MNDMLLEMTPNAYISIKFNFINNMADIGTSTVTATLATFNLTSFSDVDSA